MSDEATFARFKAEQAQISAVVHQRIAPLWRDVDPADIDRSFAKIAPQLSGIVAQAYGASTVAGAQYMAALAKGHGAALTPSLAPSVDLRQLSGAMQSTGPVAFKQALGTGQTFAQAAMTSLVRVSGSGARLAMSGGRVTVDLTSQRSKTVVGWRRVTRSGCCYFCAMLASRGSVYKSEALATFAHGKRATDGAFRDRAKGIEARIPAMAKPQRLFHDHCQCQTLPRFDGEDDPDDVLALQDWFHDVTSGTNNAAIAVQKWRREYEAVQRAEKARASQALAPSVARVVPLAERDLTAASDDDLADLMTEAAVADDAAGLDAVLGELDRRDAVEKAAAEAQRKRDEAAAKARMRRADKAEQAKAASWAEYEKLIERGVDADVAYADAFGIDLATVQRQRIIESLRANGYSGRNLDELARNAYREETERLMYAAEDYTRGAMLNAEGRAAGIDPRSLFTGPESRARKFASEELLGFWQDHGGRLTFADFKTSLVSGGRGKSQEYWA